MCDYSVSVDQLRAGEIDFVCSSPNQRVYVPATPLLRSANHEGITHLHLRTFLTEGFGNLMTD